MDHILARLIDETVPTPNRLVMDGLAAHQMKRGEEYLSQAFESANESFPPGLRFERYERCTFEEEFAISTKLKNNKRVFDLSDSDLYLVKIKMSHNGEMIPDRYIYLPFCGTAGIIHLGGTKYHLTPVLTNKVLSPERNGIFVRLLRAKLTFNRSYHSLIVDDMHKLSYVTWAPIYEKKSKRAKKSEQVAATTKAESLSVHYLLCKYGLDEMFKRYLGSVPVYGYEEVNSENYPSSDWVITRSSHARSLLAPKTYKGEKGAPYRPAELRFAFRKDVWSKHAENLIAAVYYVMDHFPDLFPLRGGLDPRPYISGTMIWNIAMGHILWSGHYGENKLLENMSEHLSSLDHYADSHVLAKLFERGYKGVSNFYDIMNLIIRDFEKILVEGGGNNLCVYGKMVETLYYVFYDITEGLFMANYKLNKQAQKKELTEKDISETLKKYLRMGAVYDLRSGKIIAEAVSYSGDNKYPKVTSKISEQANRSGSSRGKGGSRMVLDETKYLDASMLDFGNALFMSSAHPSPVSRISPFANIDPDNGTVLPQPELVEFVRDLQPRLRTRE